MQAEGGVKTTYERNIVCGLTALALDQKSTEIFATNQTKNHA